MIEAIVVGVSAGGFLALETIVPTLQRGLPVPVFLVQHAANSETEYVSQRLDKLATLSVKEAEDKDEPLPGWVYIAPAGYHLMIEAERTLSLSVDAPVHYSRPSIDVLFESAATAYRDSLLGVLLTGANKDGARGLQAIATRGGTTIVEDPTTAHCATMPQAALDLMTPDHVLSLDQIAGQIEQIVSCNSPMERAGS